MHNDEMRALLSTVEKQIAGVTATATTDGDRARGTELTSSFGDLVKLIGLGPAPETRKCPHCGGTGMRAATVCGYCWKKLAPLA